MGIRRTVIVIEMACNGVGAFAAEVGCKWNVLVKEMVEEIEVMFGFTRALLECLEFSETCINGSKI